MRFHGPTIARGEGESVRVHGRLAVIVATRFPRCHYFGDGCFEASSFAVELPASAASIRSFSCLRPVTLLLDWSVLRGTRCLWQSVPLQMNLAGRVCQTVATGRLLGCPVPLHQDTASFGSAVDQGSGLQNEHARVIGGQARSVLTIEGAGLGLPSYATCIASHARPAQWMRAALPHILVAL
jgi:hypothetical protein